MTNPKIKPAVLTIGDELVFGERDNGNQTWLAHTLYARGFPAHITLSIGDDLLSIATWIRHLRDTAHTPILISGGLGGTHDDQTRAAIAKAYEVPLTRHPECYALLLDRYKDQINPERERMAWLPQGCTLITNPLGAPGFSIDETHAFPGFPKMLEPMATDVLDRLFANHSTNTFTVYDFKLPVREGDIAKIVEVFAKRLTEGRIGIYPNADLTRVEITLRLRVTAAEQDVLTDIETWINTQFPLHPQSASFIHTPSEARHEPQTRDSRP